jgi:MSHA biogenesis protein MshQ
MTRPILGTGLLLILMTAAPADVSAQVVFRSASSAALAAGSAGISYVDEGGTDNAGSGSVTPSLPNYQTGDLLLCMAATHDDTTVAISNGWNTLYSLSNGNGHRASMFWRIAANTSLADPTITHNGNSIVARCVSYRGVDQGNPFDVSYAAASSANDSTIDSGALSTVTAGAWVLFASHIADNPGSLTMSTTGGLSWTTRFFSTTGSGNDSGIALFDSGPLTPRTVGPVTATSSTNAANTGVLVVLRPSGGNTLTIPKPAGTATDDLMIASVSVRSSTIQTTPPSDWTLVREVVRSGTSSSVLRTYYKIASASEPASYAWTMSGGAHIGVVGGILAFSGTDLVTPIADETGVATVSATTHTALGVTTSKANSVLLTVHEYASSGTWSPPAGMTEAIDISSQAPSNTNGVSMEMNYELRSTIGATGTRQATANGNADLGATQSLAINPAGGLSCFGDDFNRANGNPGANWLVGNEGGSFGNPSIVNNRLRLTNASGQVSTFATLQRIFPGAGNKIIVEFMQYSYGGTGADGMGIVLSDASQPPTAGAFGGSMGYAPKQTSQGGDTTHEGFAGGWLGVALDEFGNYSSNTEGRSGGSAPGTTPDSVAIRGSGSGFTGYAYLAGTGSLTPGVDNAASSAPAPGYKYRITVDHSDSIHAWTSVERDTGSGYAFVVPVFDAKASSGQAAVPTNWRLSYTGATGGNANIHEIDSLQVCSITQRVLTLHHIQLEHPSRTCSSGTVVVKACADANCTALYTGTVTVDLGRSPTTNSSWSSDPVTFTGGQTEVTLNKSDTGNITISGTATSPIAASATRCFSESAETCVINFANACFDAVETGAGPSTPIYTKLVGTNFSLDVLAVSNASIDTGYRGTVSVSLVDPTAASGNCSDANPGLLNIGNVSFTSTNPRGRRSLTVNYPNAARNARLRMTTTDGVSTCSADNFSIRPKLFSLSTDVPAPGPYPAGADFHITANPSVNAGYDGTPNLNLGQVVSTPASANLPLSGDFTQAAGSVSQGTFQYDDVGTLGFSANAVTDTDFTAVDQVTGLVNGVDHGTTQDCFAGNTTNTLNGRYGCVIGSTATSTGRFRPDHYDLNVALSAACSNKFTYMGQNALGITLGLQAMSANGVQLARYGANYSPLSTFSIIGDDSGTSINPLNGRLTPDLPISTGSSAANPTGQFQWTAGGYAVSGNYSFDRNTVPDGSYESFALKTTVTDPDGVMITSLNGTPVSASSALSNSTAIRFGRLVFGNVSGSELLNLPVQATTQYWKKNIGFVTNTDDSCTVINASSMKLQNTSGGLNAGNMPSNNFSGSLTFSGGKASTTINKPITPPSSRGSVDLCVDLGADNTPGTICSASSANMPWLQGRWNGAGTLYDDDPSAHAVFGVYKGGPVIYMRELY